MKRLVLAAAMMLSAIPAMAQDYLEPEHSAYSGGYINLDYEALVTSVLHVAYDRNVVARMIVEPSFYPESAVGIRAEPDRFKPESYRIFALKPAAQLWSYIGLQEAIAQQVKTPSQEQGKEIVELKSHLPAGDPHQWQIASCSTEISATRARRIISLWEKMLAGAHYPSPSDESVISSDGVIFHFSGGIQTYGMSGRVDSPDQNSNAGLLVQIGDTLKGICEKSEGADFEKLDGFIARLEAKLR